MHTFLITFPNLFETKHFIENPTYSKLFKREGTQYNSRHITIRSQGRITLIIKLFIKEYPNAVVVNKEFRKGKVKYTKLSKGTQ